MRARDLDIAKHEPIAADKFKSYVHDRLDKMNVPRDPAPWRTKATGCRIEGRLDWLQLMEHYRPLGLVSPCKFCGVVILWPNVVNRSPIGIEDGIVAAHVCRTSHIAELKARKKGKTK